ncbi:DUF2795 domain-containing protein [Actinokineospora iranica]|uniref:DUF2795 domain-containing protein n=1 Tax=Actinokineospora iranica TaxID=1271860 RepID=A0A1G6S4H1_9PSEU|nr:DUF2795 domain-containing protein [Actinokineospora iranica]SDD11749.1 Protein of unknown function [Actinokineospora iranica]
MSASTTRDRLKEALNEVDFPASKDDLLAAADERGDGNTIRALRAIPPVEYANLAEVFASVAFDDDKSPRPHGPSGGLTR